MKDWIQLHCPDDRDLSSNKLRQAVRVAWDVIPNDFSKELIESSALEIRLIGLDSALPHHSLN